MIQKTIFEKSLSRGFGSLINFKVADHNSVPGRKFAASKRRRMVVFAHDYIGTQINQFGFNEREELELLIDSQFPFSSQFSAS